MRAIALLAVFATVLPVVGCDNGGDLGTAINSKRQRAPVPFRPIDAKLLEAINQSDLWQVKKLIADGANPNAVEEFHVPEIENLSELPPEMAEEFTKRKSYKGQGWTPLTRAIGSNNSEIALYLLQVGSEPSLPMNDGTTPLHMAARYSNIALVKALLNLKVDVNARTIESPDAIYNEESERTMAEFFEPHFKDSGKTPLFDAYASWFTQTDIPELLLKSGADPMAKDDNGWTLMHYAAKFSSVEVIDILLKMGLDSNARSKQGYTPLHVAMRCGFGSPSPGAIKKLLAAGADPTLKNKQGQTPEDLLRADAVRLLASENLAPETSALVGQNITALRAYNAGLLALRPGATPILFPKSSTLVDGWEVYPPLKVDYLGQVERKVKSESGRTLLSLTYKPKKSKPSKLTIRDVTLNAYEPSADVPVALEADKELFLEFPPEAGPEGGAVKFISSYKTENSSGYGDWGDHSLIPNPGFGQRETSKGLEYTITCDEISRPLEFRIDLLMVGGKELKDYRGKVILVQPTRTSIDFSRGGLTGGTPLVTIKKDVNRSQQVLLEYSYRLKGNKKWTSQKIVL